MLICRKDSKTGFMETIEFSGNVQEVPMVSDYISEVEERHEREESEFFHKNLERNGATYNGFSIGEEVIFINDCGINFIMEILGFSDDGKIHFKGYRSPYWFGHYQKNVFKMPDDMGKVESAANYVQTYFKENPYMACYGIDCDMREKIEEFLK